MPSEEVVVIIGSHGQITFLSHKGLDGLAGLGESTTVRASQVYPLSTAKKAAFFALRWLFGEDSAMGEWTRRWKGPWMVDLAKSNGPKSGPFDTRSEAIAFEESWLVSQWTAPTT